MKKFKLLPTILMLVLCVGVLAVGVFAITPTKNTISGTITINAANTPFTLEVYVDNEESYRKSYEVRSGVTINIQQDLMREGETFAFDMSKANNLWEVAPRSLRFKITNSSTTTKLGAYFLEGEPSSTNGISNNGVITTADGTKPVANAEFTTYTIINENNGTGEALMVLKPATWEALVGNINYTLYVEEYQAGMDYVTNYEQKTGDVVGFPYDVWPPNEDDPTDVNIDRFIIAEGIAYIEEDSFCESGFEDENGEYMPYFFRAEEVVLPRSLREIEYNAFYDIGVDVYVTERLVLGGCSNLQTVNSIAGLTIDFLPNSIVSIGDDALGVNGDKVNWEEMINLTEIGCGNFTDYVGELDLSNCKKLTSIGGNNEDGVSFATGLTGLKLPSTITSIGDYAFRGCELGEVDLSNCTKLTSIGDFAFSNASIEEDFSPVDPVVTGIKLPSSLTEIGVGAFAWSGINEITLNCPNLTTISEHAFMGSHTYVVNLKGCTSLKTIEQSAFSTDDDPFMENRHYSISLPNSIETIGSGAFDGRYFGSKVDLSNCTKLTEIDGFSWCNGIDNLIFPNTIKTIKRDAFGTECGILGTGIGWLPKSIEVIEDRAFANLNVGVLDLSLLPNLTTLGEMNFIAEYVYLPNNLSSIGVWAEEGFWVDQPKCTVYSTNTNLNSTSFSISWNDDEEPIYATVVTGPNAYEQFKAAAGLN